MSAAAVEHDGSPKFSHEAEQNVLGPLLCPIDGAAAWQRIVPAKLKSADFYEPVHRAIFDAIVPLAAAGAQHDSSAVAERVGTKVPAEYLKKLADNSITSSTITTYAARVKKLAVLRADTGVTPFQVVWFATMKDVVHRDQLIKGLLATNTLALIFGEPGSGKSFLALDMGLAIAGGRPWRGRKTKKGLVIYVAGEGAASVQMRAAAYRHVYQDADQGMPFCILPEAVDFLSDESVDRLIATIHTLESEAGERAVLVIVDTLSRSMEGNENAPEIMGAAVNSAERIRAACDEVTVAFIHHAGKDASRGPRGHSKLNAAIDTEIMVEGKTGSRTASVTKQRDLPIGDKFAFELRQIVLGTDADGDPITSCVVEEGATPVPAAIVRIKGENKVRLFTALKEWRRTHPGKDIISSIDLTDIAKAQKLTGSRKREAVEGLEKDGVLLQAAGGHRLTEEGFTT